MECDYKKRVLSHLEIHYFVSHQQAILVRNLTPIIETTIVLSCCLAKSWLTSFMKQATGRQLLMRLFVIARPKGGLFRYHVKRIHFTMQGLGFLSAILRQNWWPCTTTTEVPPLFNLARFDLNKDCCWKNYLQTDSDYFSHSICSFINCISIEITIQLNS